MKGLFVDSTYNISQGTTDFGYYIDGDGIPGSGDELEEMVENDEAYFVEIFPVQNSGVFIRLRSGDRRRSSELSEEIGLRRRGLEKTLYQSTGDPVLPRNYDSREDEDEAIAVYAEYALEHGKQKAIEVDDVDWDGLLEHGRDF